MPEISAQLHTAMTISHLSLLVMALVYTIRLLWLYRFQAGRERQGITGVPGRTSPRRGFIYSWANVAMPWEMESTRRKWYLYIQFVIFHLGVACAITMTFLIPYAPSILAIPAVFLVFRVLIGGAFIVGILRIVRRLTVRAIRAISTPDDHFSLWLLTAWFFFAFQCIPNTPHLQGEFVYLAYFWMTTFFLLYVPFSKISHYLYYPITRYYFGKTMGYRGVYPIVKSR